MQTQAIIWCNAYNYLYERNKGCISVAELDSGIQAYIHKYLYHCICFKDCASLYVSSLKKTQLNDILVGFFKANVFIKTKITSIMKCNGSKRIEMNEILINVFKWNIN